MFFSRQSTSTSKHCYSSVSYILSAICVGCIMMSSTAAVSQALSGLVKTAPVITIAAGSYYGAAGSVYEQEGGDGGPATGATISGPGDVALNAAGDLYIADTSANVIRKVTASTGIITTVAGNFAKAGFTGGYSGDGGAATSAELDYPIAIALDGAGNLYIADNVNRVIRKVTASTGVITTVAGNATKGGPSSGYSGEGGPATNASIAQPGGVAVDSDGNIYFTDTYNGLVLKVTVSTGIISTVAGDFALFGTVVYPSLGDGGPATSARLVNPTGVRLDAAGNIYIADSFLNTVRKVNSSTGNITTVAGFYNFAQGGYGGDGGAATSATLSSPQGIALDSANNLYICDAGNMVIRKVDASTGIISTVAGDFAKSRGFSGDGGLATAAQLNYPDGIVVDGSGSLYIAEYDNNLIRKVDSGTTQATTPVATSATAQNVLLQLTAATAISGFTVPATESRNAEFTLGTATGCTVGTTSNAAGTICTIPVTFTPQYPGVRTGALTVMNGSTIVGTVGLSGTGVAPLGAFSSAASVSVASPSGGLSDPNGLAVDAAGNLYVGDSANNRVVEITPSGVETTIESGLSFPYAVAVDAAGNVALVADVPGVGPSSSGGYGTGGSVILQAPEGTQTTVGSVPGAPGGVAVDAAGNVYLSDAVKNNVLKFTSAGSQITLPATGLSKPGAVTVDAAGNVYVADAGNNRVVELTAAGVQTTIAATGLGQPTGVAVDTAGDVYILDNTNKFVLEVSPAGLQTTLPITGLDNPNGLAVDGAGNVYVLNSNSNNILKLSVGQTALTFAATDTATSSPQQVVTLKNIGNQPLVITAVAASANFNLNGSGTTCMTATTLTAGQSCWLGVEFQPSAAGTLTGMATVTDNSSNAVAPNNVQAVALSGAAIAMTQTTLTTSPSSVFAGAPVTLAATVTAIAGGTPVGSVTFTSGSLALGMGTLNGSGVATVTTGLLPAGSDPVTASFSGSAGYAASTSTNTVVVSTASFSFAPTTTGTTTLSVAQGATTMTTFTISPEGSYAGSVAFSCTGLPAYASCTFSPSTLALTGASPATTVTLTLNTDVQTARMETLPLSKPFGPMGPFVPAVAGGLVGLTLMKRKRLGRLLSLVALAGVMAAGLGGCSGESGSTTTAASTAVTPTGSSTVSVVATGTSPGVVTTQTLPLTLTITQ